MTYIKLGQAVSRFNKIINELESDERKISSRFKKKIIKEIKSTYHIHEKNLNRVKFIKKSK